MAKEKSRDAESAEEEMTESQRLTLLERAMNLNRVFLVLLALLIIISLSVTITVTIVSLMGTDETPALKAEVDALRQEVDSLLQDNKALNARLAVITDELPRLRSTLQNSSAPTFQRLLVEQEESYQEFIRGVKEGMYDLARMVPGSRTWLELYNERMDRALQLSQERQRQLTRLKTGEPLIEP